MVIEAVLKKLESIILKLKELLILYQAKTLTELNKRRKLVKLDNSSKQIVWCDFWKDKFCSINEKSQDLK